MHPGAGYEHQTNVSNIEAEFHDLEYVKKDEQRKTKASTAKLVLIAIADHANDEGEAYPGYIRLQLKTALSAQGLSDTLDALEYNGLLTIGEKASRVGTNSYKINVRSLPAIARELPDILKPLESSESSHLSITTQAALVEPSLNHQLTTSREEIQKIQKAANKTVDAILENERKAPGKQWTNLPEIYHPFAKAFQDLTGIIYTKKQAFDWMDTFDEWQKSGFRPADVEAAIRSIQADGRVSISRPGSITWKLRAGVAAKHTAQPVGSFEDDPRGVW